MDFPVVVVDDGSTDDTAERLSRLTPSIAPGRIDVVRHPRNQGKAAALASGFSRAVECGATHIVTIDADEQLDPRDIPVIVREAAQHPDALIVGRRPDYIEGRPARCDLGRRFASLGVRAQTGVQIFDTQCGLRVYPAALIKQLRCRAGRYAFEAEVITRAVWVGFEVREVPVSCRYFPHAEAISHWRPWRDSLHQLGVHARLLLRAMVPWPHRHSGYQVARCSRISLLAWLNPLRSLREIRDDEIGDLELAAGLALGTVIGATPFYGLHTAMGLYTAWRLHQHPAPIILGSQVSAPPWGIGLAGLSIGVGQLLLNGSISDLDPAAIMLTGFWTLSARILLSWLLGSIVVGVFLGSIAFATGLALARIIRRSAPRNDRVDHAPASV